MYLKYIFCVSRQWNRCTIGPVWKHNAFHTMHSVTSSSLQLKQQLWRSVLREDPCRQWSITAGPPIKRWHWQVETAFYFLSEMNGSLSLLTLHCNLQTPLTCSRCPRVDEEGHFTCITSKDLVYIFAVYSQSNRNNLGGFKSKCFYLIM